MYRDVCFIDFMSTLFYVYYVSFNSYFVLSEQFINGSLQGFPWGGKYLQMLTSYLSNSSYGIG